MPKAVMISHDNILFEARVAMDMIPGMGMGGERIISYLPLSHVAGMMVCV
jgi:long-chain-fatty-acid--CoA ligase ACSBG